MGIPENLVVEGCIFDMDGTLTDTERYWDEVLEEMLCLVEENHIGNAQILSSNDLYGGTVDDCIDLLLRSGSAYSGEQLRELIIKKLSNKAILPETVMPGVKDFLQQIKNFVRLSVVSNSPSVIVRRVLEKTQLSSFFELWIAEDQVQYAKPNPQLYLENCAQFNMNPKNVIAFEDSATGCQSARAAGCFVVGVNRDLSMDLDCDLRLASFDDPEISELLDTIVISDSLRAEIKHAEVVSKRLCRWVNQKAPELHREGIAIKESFADFATAADLLIEDHVREVLNSEFPNHMILGEERGLTLDTAKNKNEISKTWFIDPIDGTTNYANGIDWYAFSLALYDGEKLLVSVIGDPVRKDIYSAVVGQPAQLNGRVLLASNNSSEIGRIIFTEWAAASPWEGMFGFLAACSQAECTTRIMGSGTLALAQAAAGRGVGAVIGQYHPEDHAAGILIAKQAGLVIFNATGIQENVPKKGAFGVAHPAQVTELVDFLAKA